MVTRNEAGCSPPNVDNAGISNGITMRYLCASKRKQADCRILYEKRIRMENHMDRYKNSVYIQLDGSKLRGTIPVHLYHKLCRQSVVVPLLLCIH